MNATDKGENKMSSLKKIASLRLEVLEERVAPAPLLVLPGMSQADIDQAKNSPVLPDQALDHISGH